MNKSEKWTEVEYSEVDNVSIKTNTSNSNIKLSLRSSPLDVPVAWRHYESEGTVAIEFKYVSATESLVTKNIKNISFELGKNSRRIYKIIVDVKGFVLSGVPKGEVSIELIQANEAATNATSTLNDKGEIKKPNAVAIINMLEHEALAMHTATAAG